MSVTRIIVHCDDDDVFAAVTKAGLHLSRLHLHHHHYPSRLTPEPVARRILKFLSALIKRPTLRRCRVVRIIMCAEHG